MFKNLFRSYDQEKDEATRRIVKRQSRGNVVVQNGWFLTIKELTRLSRRADKSVDFLNKKFG